MIGSKGLTVLLAVCAAALGAAEMTEEIELSNPSRWRQARNVNHRGRRILVSLGAQPSAALEQILIG